MEIQTDDMMKKLLTSVNSVSSEINKQANARESFDDYLTAGLFVVIFFSSFIAILGIFAYYFAIVKDKTCPRFFLHCAWCLGLIYLLFFIFLTIIVYTIGIATQNGICAVTGIVLSNEVSD